MNDRQAAESLIGTKLFLDLSVLPKVK
ncbi:hypothetical protein [Candidatus Endowatersipora endosymbiont of Watersipora subatra]